MTSDRTRLWSCPNCGRQFAKRNQWHSCQAHSVDDHFRDRDPQLRQTYEVLLARLNEFGPLRVDAVKSSINFANRYHFGGLCAVDDLVEILYLNEICDRLGLDTITAGNVAGLAIEASRCGVLDAKVDYGDVDGIAELLHQIAHREGPGALLGQGVRAASRELGLEEVAIHVKGLEPPGFDPRTLKGMGLAFAVSDRGACHLRPTVFKAELSGWVDRCSVEGKAELVLDYED